jgi:hypothetical protein
LNHLAGRIEILARPETKNAVEQVSRLKRRSSRIQEISEIGNRKAPGGGIVPLVVEFSAFAEGEAKGL